MKKCLNCNKMLEDNVAFCSECGSNNFLYENNNQMNYNQNYQYNNQYNQYQQYPYQQQNNSGSNLGHPIIWGVVGYFVPIAGIVLYFVWKNSNPEQAKGAGIGALINIVLTVIICVFYFIMFASLMDF